MREIYTVLELKNLAEDCVKDKNYIAAFEYNARIIKLQEIARKNMLALGKKRL